MEGSMVSAFWRASRQRCARRMLALVSRSRSTRLAEPGLLALSAGDLRNGRANPNANRQSTEQRRINRRICSNFERRVRRGGVDWRNINELKGARSRVVRRIKWNTKGRATARLPNRNNGARKLMRSSRVERSDPYGASAAGAAFADAKSRTEPTRVGEPWKAS